MIRYIYANDFHRHPNLQAIMHKDRAAQFRDRLKWKVSVDGNGWERDEYDAMNPLYVVWEESPGMHGGSMRFLLMSGRTMVNDHFADLMTG
jgi:N-acyl-L-homoserine lactone synthetase